AFEHTLRDFVDACIVHRKNPQRLTRKLGELFKAPNRVQRIKRMFVRSDNDPLSEWAITDVLHAPSVFISYSHADKRTVLELYKQLKNAGINLWLDHFELSPGELFQPKIEQALCSSDAILTVLSRNSHRSQWLSFEGSFFYGQEAKKLIIPVV